MSIPQDKIDTVRDLSSIVEVISGYVSLRRAGANYVGLCPFHTEKTPSFTVSEQKKIFHCFGCQAGGNVFTFLMKIKGLSFPDAVRELAGRVGVSIPRSSPGDRRVDDQRKRLFTVLRHAAEFFEKGLWAKAGGPARSYLEKRGILPETIKSFGLGLAGKEWEGLFSYLTGKGVSPQDARAAGLVVQSERHGHRDRFINRLMFPIADPRGRVVGFGGRNLEKGSKKLAKYINTPEGPLFKKSRLLYGLSQSAAEIQSSREALLVEGYTDLIALHQAGFENVVAPLGTALTGGQARLISRYAKRATVVFDGDEAGKKAAIRSLEVLLREGLEPSIVLLPAGMDPDDFLVDRGAEELKRLLGAADSLVGFFVRETARAAGISVTARAEALKRASEVVMMVPDPVARAIYLKDLAEGLGVPEDALSGRASPGRGPRAPAHKRKPGPKTTDEIIVASLFAHPELALELEESGGLGLFRDETLKEVAALFIRRVKEGQETDPASLLGHIEEPEVHSRVVELALFAEDFSEDDARSFFSDKLKAAATEAERVKREARLKDLKEKIARAEAEGDWELHRKYLLELSSMHGKIAGHG